MAPLIICLCGKRQHGKSTLANHLVQNHGFQELSFAGPLKAAAKEIFGFSDAQLYDAKEKETVDPFWKVTPREVLQICGTELFRDRLPELIPSTTDVWVKSLVRKLRNLPFDARVVISDCRFPNEWAAMRDHGARMVRVVRYTAASTEFQNHPSETALDDVVIYTPDVLLLNYGTITELTNKLDENLKTWIRPPFFIDSIHRE